MSKLQPSRRVAALALTVALGTALAACGHHDDQPTTPTNPSPTPVASDAYVTYVLQQTASSSDTAEPASTDGVAATTPETSEPIPLSGT